MWCIKQDKVWKLTNNVKNDCRKNETQVKKAMADHGKFLEFSQYGLILQETTKNNKLTELESAQDTTQVLINEKAKNILSTF